LSLHLKTLNRLWAHTTQFILYGGKGAADFSSSNAAKSTHLSVTVFHSFYLTSRLHTKKIIFIYWPRNAACIHLLHGVCLSLILISESTRPISAKFDVRKCTLKTFSKFFVVHFCVYMCTCEYVHICDIYKSVFTYK
jgi:hypothetical protein